MDNLNLFKSSNFPFTFTQLTFLNFRKTKKPIAGRFLFYLEISNNRANLKVEESMKEKIKVKEELHSCLNLLKNEQLKELFNNDEFMGVAIKVLSERRKIN